MEIDVTLWCAVATFCPGSDTLCPGGVLFCPGGVTFCPGGVIFCPGGVTLYPGDATLYPGGLGSLFTDVTLCFAVLLTSTHSTKYVKI